MWRRLTLHQLRQRLRRAPHRVPLPPRVRSPVPLRLPVRFRVERSADSVVIDFAGVVGAHTQTHCIQIKLHRGQRLADIVM